MRGSDQTFPLCAFFPWEEEANYFHTNNVNTQHAVGAHSFSCSAQFSCIPVVPGGLLGVLAEHPVLFRAFGNCCFEYAANIFLLAPCSPTRFPKFRIIVFLIQKTALNFLMAQRLPSHTQLSSVPVGRMGPAPWQPAVPDGLCSSALRSTVRKEANLTRVRYSAAAAAADRGVEGSRATEKLNLERC